jgi:hypothetical protein
VRTLPERLLLISTDDRGEARRPRGGFDYALAGAALSELLLAGRLRREDDRLVATTAAPTGEALLDEVLAEIRGQDRPRGLEWWVRRLASGHRCRKPIRDRLIGQLTARGVLLAAGDEVRVLGRVWVRTTPTVAGSATVGQERAAIGEVVLGRQEPDERAAALVALVQVSGLLGRCVPKAELRQARRRAKRIGAADEVSKAVRWLQTGDAFTEGAVVGSGGYPRL